MYTYIYICIHTYKKYGHTVFCAQVSDDRHTGMKLEEQHAVSYHIRILYYVLYYVLSALHQEVND